MMKLVTNKLFVPTNATFLGEDHMKNYQPRSKLVLNNIFVKATDKSTKVFYKVGPSAKVVDVVSTFNLIDHILLKS